MKATDCPWSLDRYSLGEEGEAKKLHPMDRQPAKTVMIRAAERRSPGIGAEFKEVRIEGREDRREW